MAIFYNHIKGCGANSTGATNSTTDLWTWISFANITESDTNASLGEENKTVNYLPDIYVATTNDKENCYDFGKIITSQAKNQTMDEDFTFNENVNFPAEKQIHFGTGSHIVEDQNAVLQIGSDSIKIQSLDTIDIVLASYLCVNDDKIKIHTGSLDDSLKYNVNISGAGRIDKMHVGNDSNYVIKNVGNGVLKVDDKCEAKYFNATSDRRAKSNITPAQFSATGVINSIPVYTFKYLNLEEPVIGLIAQEAAGHDLDGFNMVDNLDASGEFGDFMQMKESKLVYVLWKAVQELSAEVEELKAEIRNLK